MTELELYDTFLFAVGTLIGLAIGALYLHFHYRNR